jgi:hypothetical protein
MIVSDIIDEQAARSAEEIFKDAQSLPRDQQEILKKFLVEIPKLPVGKSTTMDGVEYEWDGKQWRNKKTKRSEPFPESPKFFQLFDPDVMKRTGDLYREAEQSGVLVELENLFRQKAGLKPKKSNSNKGKGKKTRTGNLVRDMQRATGRAGPSKDPGDGPD